MTIGFGAGDEVSEPPTKLTDLCGGCIATVVRMGDLDCSNSSSSEIITGAGSDFGVDVPKLSSSCSVNFTGDPGVRTATGYGDDGGGGSGEAGTGTGDAERGEGSSEMTGMGDKCSFNGLGVDLVPTAIGEETGGSGSSRIEVDEVVDEGVGSSLGGGVSCLMGAGGGGGEGEGDISSSFLGTGGGEGDTSSNFLGTGGGEGDASDAGPLDTGALDAGSLDTGASDAGSLDTGTPDAGTPDAGTPGTGILSLSSFRFSSRSGLGFGCSYCGGSNG